MTRSRILTAAVVLSVAGIAMLGGLKDVRSGESINGDYQRAVGISRAELSACIAAARQAGNTVSDSGVPGANEGDWTIAFCGRQTPTQSPAQFIGGTRLENWKVVEANCEFPAPTSNPCPVF